MLSGEHEAGDTPRRGRGRGRMTNRRSSSKSSSSSYVTFAVTGI